MISLAGPARRGNLPLLISASWCSSEKSLARARALAAVIVPN